MLISHVIQLDCRLFWGFYCEKQKKNKNELRLESGEEEGGDGLKDFD